MDKRILIPSDFSKNALNAIRYALHLYKEVKCEFYFLNVFRLFSYTTDNLFIPEPGSSEYEAAKKNSEEEFIKLLDILELHHDNAKHSYYTISTYNFLSEAIKQTIAEKDIDLVVMGTQGTTGAKGVIFGTNTVQAMEKIRECPVLAIPEDVRFTSLNEIVFPTDYTSAYKRKELKYLIEISKLHSVDIKILYVANNTDLNEKQRNNQELLEAILSETSYSFHTLSKKNVADGITTFIESRNSDMIAFINRKHFFFNSVFSKPLVKEIGYKATVPILALH
ncbi:nucleotide-binding universal stress UspA family protein [Maribacter caenipelagi]|uniref:Nucleotide-binding universal stress UspA family protein n=1 Tax=Maribacter caenipelagi TaxID=1447781 RepID=A0A4R7D9U5_9FLAO|nr:universal stress protein [Maribacter caenipelagi]TDS16805.1 nucleotide-binding universal stress UspA family protein [Maribacter caenipelagi]